MDDVVAEPACDLILQLFDPVRFELDDVARLDVDQVVVFVAGQIDDRLLHHLFDRVPLAKRVVVKPKGLSVAIVVVGL